MAQENMQKAGAAPLIARVLLDTPLPQLDHLFDYAVPDSLVHEIRVGQRVKVPFRSRQRDVLGYVVETAAKSDFAGELAVISELVTKIPLLDNEVWNLARAAADRAGGSAGDILRLAIPPRQVRAENSFLTALEKDAASVCVKFDQKVERSTAEVAELAKTLLEASRTHLTFKTPPVRLSTGEWVAAWVKTFCELAISMYEAGKSVIIVVPDFRDIDQIIDSLHAFGVTNFVRLDSRQSGAERYKQFLKALHAERQIIIGNRSTIYAPAKNLGAILLWDEADESLSEPLSPYVHARDAALIRAARSNAGLLFGANTYSTQLLRLIDLGYLQELHAGAKYGRVIHTGALTRQDEFLGRIPTLATNVLKEGLKKGPVLVQVASPGFAPVLICADCSDIARCTNCQGPLQAVSQDGARCRLCAEQARGWRCQTCHGTQFVARGVGSERTAEQFEKMFPETMIILSDGNHKRSRVDGRPALVVATRGAEPIAAGGYRATVLLDVEKILGSWHLKAGEDALRWWRGALSLTAADATAVIVGGGGPVVEAFVRGADAEWVRQELQDRAQLRFPPAVRVATVVGATATVAAAVETVKDIAGTDVLGPTVQSDGQVRAIVRFEYAKGAEVAANLRAALLRGIADGSARKHVQNKSRRGRLVSAPALKLHFDDDTVFDERGQE